MILTLHTETVIDSAHRLIGYRGKCKNLHGHSWLVHIWFKGEEKYVDKVGILVDFNIVKEIKEKLDHKVINNIVRVNPTAENLSRWIYRFVHSKVKKGIGVKIRLYETKVGKETWCEYGDW